MSPKTQYTGGDVTHLTASSSWQLAPSPRCTPGTLSQYPQTSFSMSLFSSKTRFRRIRSFESPRLGEVECLLHCTRMVKLWRHEHHRVHIERYGYCFNTKASFTKYVL